MQELAKLLIMHDRQLFMLCPELVELGGNDFVLYHRIRSLIAVIILLTLLILFL